MGKILTLYHGSDCEVPTPDLTKGKLNNDYGRGFYCTEHFNLACEWASKRKGIGGFANQYELDLTGLKILDLTKKEYSILHWITILLQNRTFSLTTPISAQAKKYLIENFGINTAGYDLISGYRADDSYFSFAEDFLTNAISVQHLAEAMRLGKLGIQHVLVSEKAFEKLRFICAKPVENDVFYQRYIDRDTEARQKYKESKANLTIASDELYVLDILREGIKNGDARIP